MLPKENRLKKKKDFERVFEEGKGFGDKFLFLKTMNNGLNQPRFGFVVSTKISKKAVVRNRLKRRLRESVKPKLGKIKKEADIVLVALKGIDSLGFKEIEVSVDKLLKKAEMLSD